MQRRDANSAWHHLPFGALQWFVAQPMNTFRAGLVPCRPFAVAARAKPVTVRNRARTQVASFYRLTVPLHIRTPAASDHATGVISLNGGFGRGDSFPDEDVGFGCSAVNADRRRHNALEERTPAANLYLECLTTAETRPDRRMDGKTCENGNDPSTAHESLAE